MASKVLQISSMAVIFIGFLSIKGESTAALAFYVQPPEPRVEPKAIDSSQGTVILSKLTAHIFSNRAPGFKHPFGLCPVGEGDSEFTFSANGHYEHRWIPLSGEKPLVRVSGKWNLQPGPNGTWLACFDSGERHLVTLFDSGAIQLDGWKYPLRKVAAGPESLSVDGLPAIQLPESIKQRIAVLTSHAWYRQNDVNLDRYPAMIEFQKDFTYKAYTPSGRSYPAGFWYASADKIHLTGPRDEHGESDYLRDEGAHAAIEIDNPNRIIIDSAPYVTKEQLSTKGVIWSIGGYKKELTVRIEYDMPIRKGIPCRFEVTFVQTPNMIAQRFSVTNGFEYEYRKPDSPIKSAKEIAAVNLNDTLIGEQETKSFSLDVTFPESGQHTYYLNALIKGPTQNWDLNEAFTFQVLQD